MGRGKDADLTAKTRGSDARTDWNDLTPLKWPRDGVDKVSACLLIGGGETGDRAGGSGGAEREGGRSEGARNRESVREGAFPIATKEQER